MLDLELFENVKENGDLSGYDDDDDDVSMNLGDVIGSLREVGELVEMGDYDSAAMSLGDILSNHPGLGLMVQHPYGEASVGDAIETGDFSEVGGFLNVMKKAGKGLKNVAKAVNPYALAKKMISKIAGKKKKHSSTGDVDKVGAFSKSGYMAVIRGGKFITPPLPRELRIKQAEPMAYLSAADLFGLDPVMASVPWDSVAGEYHLSANNFLSYDAAAVDVIRIVGIYLQFTVDMMSAKNSIFNIEFKDGAVRPYSKTVLSAFLNKTMTIQADKQSFELAMLFPGYVQGLFTPVAMDLNIGDGDGEEVLFSITGPEDYVITSRPLTSSIKESQILR